MEAVIFVGIQAAGKSSFYLARFFATHVRINLDMLRSRRRETLLLLALLEMQQPFVVDNTNPTAEERALYILAARAAGFQIAGYYFPAGLAECIGRNKLRPDAERVPAQAIGGTAKKLQPPAFTEGFDALYIVRIAATGAFLVEAWPAPR